MRLLNITTLRRFDLIQTPAECAQSHDHRSPRSRVGEVDRKDLPPNLAVAVPLGVNIQVGSSQRQRLERILDGSNPEIGSRSHV
jgi:hypothetical protein